MKKFPFWRLVFSCMFDNTRWKVHTLLSEHVLSISEVKITVYRTLIKISNVDFFLIYLFIHCFSLYGNPNTKAKLSWRIQRREDTPGFGLVLSLDV